MPRLARAGHLPVPLHGEPPPNPVGGCHGSYEDRLLLQQQEVQDKLTGGRSSPVRAGSRREMTENLRRHLDESPCVPGETNESLQSDPVAELLTRAYAKGEGRLARAVDAAYGPAVLRHGAAVGVTLRELVRLPTLLPTSFAVERVPTSDDDGGQRAELEAFLDAYVRDTQDEAGGEAEELAELLGRSYCKALAELKAALDQNDITYITHHTAVVADLVKEMIDIYVLRTDRYPEQTLPDEHPHKRMNADLLSEVGEGG
jgi:hypothetical protein